MAKDIVNFTGNRNEEFNKQIQDLKDALEREQEWKPYENPNLISTFSYENMKDLGYRVISEETALDFVSKYGFSREKVEIRFSLPVYEINRHNQKRVVGSADYSPLFFEDGEKLNFVCFSCCGYDYMIYKGNLFMVIF